MIIDNNNYIEQLKNKNEDALQYVLDTFGNLIYKISFLHLNSKELSEGCVYDVLFKVWTSIDTFKYSNDKFKNWVCAITKYTAIDIIRKEKRFITNVNLEDNGTLSTNENIEEECLLNEEITLINKSLNKLKKIDKNIFIDRFFHNNSIKFISEKYNISTNAVELKLFRIKKKLKTLKT